MSPCRFLICTSGENRIEGKIERCDKQQLHSGERGQIAGFALELHLKRTGRGLQV